jgi:hypothetical protein
LALFVGSVEGNWVEMKERRKVLGVFIIAETAYKTGSILIFL